MSGIHRISLESPPKMVMDCKFFNQPFISFMILLLEDRVVYNIETLLERLHKTRYAADPEIRRLIKSLIWSSNNPAKRGVIGKYIDTRSKMFNMDELCALADVCSEYDKTIQIQERILKKITKKHLEQYTSLSGEDRDLVADIIICIINADMVKSYYAEFDQKLDYLEIRFNGIKISPTPFNVAKNTLDLIAVSIVGHPLDFSTTEGFDKAHRAYINTINNDQRMMRHFNDLGIEKRVKTKVGEGIFSFEKIVRIENKSTQI